MDFEFERLTGALATNKAVTDLFIHVFKRIKSYLHVDFEWKNGYMIARTGKRGVLVCVSYHWGHMSFLWIEGEGECEGRIRYKSKLFSSVVSNYNETEVERQKSYFNSIFDRLNLDDTITLGVPPDGWEEWQLELMSFTLLPGINKSARAYCNTSCHVSKISNFAAVLDDLNLIPLYAEEAGIESREFNLCDIPFTNPSDT